MTEKQKRFCDEYLIDLNATQAAIRAGYSQKTAYSVGQRLLKNVEIESYIEEQLEVVRTSKTAEVAEILEYLTSVMRAQETDGISCGNRLKAAEMLGKYYGMYTDKAKIESDIGRDFVFNILPASELQEPDKT